MEISKEQSLKQLAEFSEQDLRLIADPYQGEPIMTLANSQFQSVLIAIGPEGGFDESESSLARESRFKSVTLGPAILRVETAALAVASILGIGREDETSA